MKNSVHKIFWGLLLLLSAAALIFYGIGGEAGFFGIPLYKLLLGLILVSWIVAKVFFSESLRQRFKIFFPLAFLFMLFEPEIADCLRYPDENIINNWLLLLAALLANIAMTVIIPKKSRKSYSKSGNRCESYGFGEYESYDKKQFSDSVIYIDASITTKSYVKNTCGETNVYYQNSDRAVENVVYTLTVENSMGETNVHVPADWVVKNEMSCFLGEINTRKNPQGEVKLIIRGENNLGETNIL
ncbi:MAG: hypothetical protein IKZ05_02030 [Clostridia bacterium]|nr:hypothetical protein [Clostridia bacterium]